ncbi:MAG: 2-oxo acid dehydrogenase subunit E2 [Actinobacteria bacterium]|nr:2-oxo acid dehydrogenase subunit E2 [Actinomycetota bacterium]
MRDFTLPSLGADMDEGKLLEWLVTPGDEVTKGQVIALVDTSKATLEVEIWFDGTVHELLTEIGEVVPVGEVMARFLEPGEVPGEAVAAPSPPPSAAVAPPQAGRRRVSPAARRRAKELGIDLDGVTGSGPEGAVTLADVESAARPGAEEAVAPVAAAPVAESASPADKQAAMRQAIAAAMSRSKREIPHYYLSETIPMRRAVEWLTAENAQRPITERLLMTVVQLKAVALALREFPEMNGFFRDGAFEASPAVHLGVAVALRQGGLVAPAIHDVADKDLTQLMRDLTDLVRRVRAGSLKSSELSDPTITVTNLGEQGVEAVYGVIYPPQVAIVGFGRVMERPWVEDLALTVAPTVIASLAADHRVSDGRRGALFLANLRDRLQRPEDL